MKLTRRGKIVIALGIVATVFGLPALGGYLYLRSIGVLIASDPGARVEVEIPKGASVSQVGEVLEDAGVIRSAMGFRVAVFLNSGSENIQAGTYKLRRGLSAPDALDAVLEGPTVEFVTVTFPEGSWLADFAAIVDRETHIAGERFLEVARSGEIRSRFQPPGVDTLEGLLFPATYQVVESDTAESLVRRLVDEFDERAVAAGVDGGAMGLSPYEVIIVASMVEAEAQIDDERGKIARVIYNRLEVGEKLGIDATVNYAIGRHGLDLTQSELAVDSPYNTRLYAGLPPTPIGASGEASLTAAMTPPEGDWFFYVLADCEGRHAFSETASEFAQDKAAYQLLNCG